MTRPNKQAIPIFHDNDIENHDEGQPNKKAKHTGNHNTFDENPDEYHRPITMSITKDAFGANFHGSANSTAGEEHRQDLDSEVIKKIDIGFNHHQPSAKQLVSSFPFVISHIATMIKIRTLW